MKENGTYVQSTFDAKFQTSLFVKTDVVMEPGNYIFMIDPVWHPSAFLDDNYRDVLIDIYGPEQYHIQPLDFGIGLQHLAETLKHFSCNRSPLEQRDFYLKDN